jgi:peptidoglycan hydrolase-like protein with peptidoglycan-binding domain
MTVYAATFVSKLLSQRGDHYLYGGEIKPGTANPDYYDCSEYTEWAAHIVGGYLPDGSWAQHDYCQRKNTMISVATALKTSGALLFHPGHVAVSLGNGKTIEARGRNYGVGIFDATGRDWTSAAKVPGMTYGPLPKPPATAAPKWPGRYITQPPMWRMNAAEVKFQQRLHDLGLYKGAVDGLYGPNTEAATVELQTRKGLVRDGICGPLTWYAAWRA